MTVSELKELLARFEATPVRSRGQHFLLDESAVAALADAAGIGRGSAVLEIGPGPGILTAELLRRGADLTAVELDRKMCALLRHRFIEKKFTLIQGDIIEIKSQVLSGLGSGYALVANLPYNITSETLVGFLTEEPKPRSLTLMVQREVADRVLAKPKNMSSLAVLVQTYGEPSRVRNVPAGAFYPPPEVDSSVIHIRVKTPAEIAAFFAGVPAETYFALVKAAFAARRKQLKNSLDDFFFRHGRDAGDVFGAAKVAPTARPEELTLEDWKSLAKALTS